jgi:iron complex outermembrane receptor protein
MTQDTLGNTCFFFGLGCPPAFVDLNNPSFPFPFTKPSPAAGIEFYEFFNFNNTYLTKGIYAQIQSSLYERVHLLAGGRLASINITYNEFAPLALPGAYITDQTKLLPRAGILVDLFQGLSAFASYSEGMKWAGFVPVAQPQPEFSQQVEGGLKFDFNGQLSGTLATFEIERQNVPVITGPGQANLTQQQSRGFEADIIFQPNRNWSFLGSYAYTEATYSDPFLFNGTTVKPGNRILGVPLHSGRIWANYKFDQPALRGWSVGAGVYMASSQFVDPTNLWETGGYYTVDAKVAYEDDRFRAAITAKNLTGQEYFTPYTWFGGQVAPSAPRAVYGQLALKFN